MKITIRTGSEWITVSGNGRTKLYPRSRYTKYRAAKEFRADTGRKGVPYLALAFTEV